jgi:hypothetical protein
MMTYPFPKWLAPRSIVGCPHLRRKLAERQLWWHKGRGSQRQREKLRKNKQGAAPRDLQRNMMLLQRDVAKAKPRSNDGIGHSMVVEVVEPKMPYGLPACLNSRQRGSLKELVGSFESLSFIKLLDGVLGEE